MDERIDQTEQLLRFEVTDAARAEGRYRWVNDDADPDPEVVAFLVNYYRTAGAAFDALMAEARAVSAERDEAVAQLASLRLDEDRVAHYDGHGTVLTPGTELPADPVAWDVDAFVPDPDPAPEAADRG